MGMPDDIEIIDTMIGLPSHDRKDIYKFLSPELRDAESGTFKMPAQYMFKDIPAEIDADADPVAVTLYHMNRIGSAQIALLTPLEAALTVLWSLLWLAEVVTSRQSLGILLILLSTLLAARWLPPWQLLHRKKLPT